MRHLPSFSALRAFEATAKHGSLKAAANELNLTSSAISHQIRKLEKDLNVALFQRTTTGVVLTDVGMRYLKSIGSALEIVEKATTSITNKKNVEVLKISTLSTLSTLWLIPKLNDFHQQFPDIRVDLLDEANICDFKDTDIDAAIRYDFYGNQKWPKLLSIPLMEEYLMPVCSKKYLQRFPDIAKPERLIKSKLLVNHRHPDEWDKWFASQGYRFSTQNHSSHIKLDTSNMTLTAAKNSLGVALGRTPFVDKFLLNDQLVPVTSNIQFRGVRHYLVYPSKANQNINFHKFKEWILATASEANAEYRNLGSQKIVNQE